MTRMAHRRSIFARATPPIRDGRGLDAKREVEKAAERAERRRSVWPWVASLLFHVPLFLAVVLIVKIAANVLDRDSENRIVIPTSFTDPELSNTPGPPSPGAGDPSRDAAQKNLKDLLKSDGWNESATDVNLTTLLKGKAETDMPLIGVGTQGGDDAGAGAVASPYGAPTGNGGTFKSTFYRTGGNAQKIVFLIDHTGSLSDSFGGANADISPGTVKAEVQRSISKLLPIQFFSVVVFTGPDDGGAKVLGPSQLLRATPDNKTLVLKKLGEDGVAQGGDDENEILFVQGFRAAFALRPQLIYFLTDGDMARQKCWMMCGS